MNMVFQEVQPGSLLFEHHCGSAIHTSYCFFLQTYGMLRAAQDSNSTLSHRIGSGVENEVLIRALPAHSSQFPSVLSPAN